MLPIYCFDPRQFGANLLDFTNQIYGEAKMGLRRGKFCLESVLDLKRNLRSIRSDLLISVGYTEDVISRTHQNF